MFLATLKSQTKLASQRKKNFRSPLLYVEKNENNSIIYIQ